MADSNSIIEPWADYYQRIHASGNAILDYSNPQTQAQTFALALEAAGPIEGKRCLDVGCGRGQLSLALSALQAREVVGVDIIAETIAAFRQKHPFVRWETGSPDNESFCQSLGSFDVIFAVEVLQYVDWQRTIHILWNCLNPDGRIVIVIPNKDNAIVQKTIERFAGEYRALNPGDFVSFIPELPNLACWAYRGMDFGQDQRILPYVPSNWADSVIKEYRPNRLVVVLKKGTSTSDRK